jgi:hypothetical protein
MSRWQLFDKFTIQVVTSRCRSETLSIGQLITLLPNVTETWLPHVVRGTARNEQRKR